MEPTRRGVNFPMVFRNFTSNKSVGKTISLNVNERTSVRDLIYKIAMELNIKPDEIWFTLPGRSSDPIKVTLKNAEEVEEEIQSLFNKSVVSLLTTESTPPVFQIKQQQS